ncbi:hypothetical protein PL84_03880, partial [Vibrio anguillarum]
MTIQSLKQPEQQSEIIVDANQLAVAEQVGDQTQQQTDGFQPKILAILGEIESNTSALSLLRGVSGTKPDSPLLQQSNTKPVSNKHHSNTSQVLAFVKNPLTRKAGAGKSVENATSQIVANPRKVRSSVSRDGHEVQYVTVKHGANNKRSDSTQVDASK